MTRGANAPRRRAGVGTLAVVAILLAASGALRLGNGIGEAIALTTDAPAVPPPDPPTCPEPPAALSAALSLREERLALREAAIEDRMAALSLSDAVITQRLAELAEAEASLAATLALADKAAEDDLARLTTVYETMKPKDAAALFAAMDPAFAAGFLGRMRPDAAAMILAGMEPQAAYGVSLLLAGRNAAAPTE